MGKEVNEENGVWELCPNCENEVFILKNEVSSCPICHNRILPCSMCYDCTIKGDICPVWNVKA